MKYSSSSFEAFHNISEQPYRTTTVQSIVSLLVVSLKASKCTAIQDDTFHITARDDDVRDLNKKKPAAAAGLVLRIPTPPPTSALLQANQRRQSSLSRSRNNSDYNNIGTFPRIFLPFCLLSGFYFALTHRAFPFSP